MRCKEAFTELQERKTARYHHLADIVRRVRKNGTDMRLEIQCGFQEVCCCNMQGEEALAVVLGRRVVKECGEMKMKIGSAEIQVSDRWWRLA